MWVTLAQNTASNSPGPLPPCISGHHEGSVRSIRSGGGVFDKPPSAPHASLLFRCLALGFLGPPNIFGVRGGETNTRRPGPPPAPRPYPRFSRGKGGDNPP